MIRPQGLPEHQRDMLQKMMQQPDEQISLARAALVVAAGEYPDLDPAKYIQRLDAMAAAIGERITGEMDFMHVIERLNQYLFEEEGFVGNAQDYYDPRNSFLNDVMDRKTGIPITLSTVYLEIAERLKMPLVGVGLPGHFLVKHPYFDILIDPYSKGRILSEEDCRQQMNDLMGDSVPFDKCYLEAVSKRHIIGRMLNNLRSIYMNARQFPKALLITEMALVIQPDAPHEWKHRAALLVHLHRYRDAIADLNHYLLLEPATEDADEIRKMITDLQRSLARLN